MKVIKFGSSTATSPQRLLEITNLVSQYNDSANIIVFSAIDGTTESLEEIADYLYKKNADGAKELYQLGKQIVPKSRTFRICKIIHYRDV